MGASILGWRTLAGPMDGVGCHIGNGVPWAGVEATSFIIFKLYAGHVLHIYIYIHIYIYNHIYIRCDNRVTHTATPAANNNKPQQH